MSHFAKVLDGKVTQVIVAEPEFFETFVDTTPGTWIQTSYNTFGNAHRSGGTPLRGNFAGIGFNYDAINDVFYAPQPYKSWVLSPKTYLWEAPISYPSDNKQYKWDESIGNWEELA